MALSGKAHGKNLYFNIDLQGGGTPTDISAYVKSVDGLPGEIELGDVTAGGSTGYKYFPGLQKATITLECIFDDAASSAWTILKNFMSDTTTRSFIYGPAGSTSGYAKVSGECRIQKVGLPAKVTDVLIFTVEMLVDDAITVDTFT